MGQSTNGTLVFGIDFGEELPEFLEEYSEDGDDWWEFTDAISGVEKDDPEGWDKRSKFRESHVADLVLYCSGEYPMYILAVNGTETTVRRGDVEEIDPAKMTVSPEVIQKFKDFCGEYGVEWEEPRWLLCSMWN